MLHLPNYVDLYWLVKTFVKLLDSLLQDYRVYGEKLS